MLKMAGTIRGAVGDPPAGAIPTIYEHKQGDTAIRAEVQHLLNIGQSTRQIMTHLTDHAQYPPGEIRTMLGSIQTLLPRPHLNPNQSVVLPLTGFLDTAGKDVNKLPLVVSAGEEVLKVDRQVRRRGFLDFRI